MKKDVTIEPLMTVQHEPLPPGSDEWRQVRALRYALFYEMHGLPESIMDDGLDEGAHHVYIKHCEQVVAYGRATPLPDGRFLVTAMVVAPSFHQQGLGRQIMNAIIDIAWQQNAKGLTLKSRTTAAGFYAKFGFLATGGEFPSAITGIPHVNMKLQLS